MAFMRSHPDVALLAGSSYGVMITDAGAGFSTWRDLDVTRWREDATLDCWGQFFYVRDLADNSAWSIGTQPMIHSGEPVEFEPRSDGVALRRRHGDIETRCDVRVVTDADAEVRVVALTNHGNRRRDTRAHELRGGLPQRTPGRSGPPGVRQAVSRDGIRCGPRCAPRATPTAGCEGAPGLGDSRLPCRAPAADQDVAYETDRHDSSVAAARRPIPRRWIRDHACREPLAPCSIRSSACAAGSRSNRRRTASIAFLTGAADTRETASRSPQRFRGLDAVDEAFTAAKACAEKELRDLQLTADEVALFNRLAASVIFTSAALRDARRDGGQPSGSTGPVAYSVSPATSRSSWRESHRPMMRRSSVNSFGGAPTRAASPGARPRDPGRARRRRRRGVDTRAPDGRRRSGARQSRVVSSA